MSSLFCRKLSRHVDKDGLVTKHSFDLLQHRLKFGDVLDQPPETGPGRMLVDGWPLG
jgi:hypothetical protein